MLARIRRLQIDCEVELEKNGKSLFKFCVNFHPIGQQQEVILFLQKRKCSNQF